MRGVGKRQKKDYEDSRQTILETLREHGRLRWNELYKKSKLSKSTLYKHLQQLQEDNVVERFVDRKSDEYPPPVYYSLTSDGRDEFEKQEDIKTLTLGRISISGSPELLPREVGVKIDRSSQPSMRKYSSYLEGANNLGKCIKYSVYSSRPLENTDKKFAKVLAEAAAESVLTRLALGIHGDAVARFQEIPGLTFLFRLDSDRFREFLRNRKQLFVAPRSAENAPNEKK